MITRRQLASDLAALGLPVGDCVMMHSSLSALGPVEGGAETVVAAILDVIGATGTILVPAFRDSVWGRPDDFANTDCDCAGSAGLCPSQQPGLQGVIAETVRLRPGSLRSCHPTHSWAALGPAARTLIEDHRNSPTPCGTGNPFEALMKLDGCILTLGVQVNTVTLWHYYEEILRAPYLGHYWPKQRHLNHCVAGRRVQYEFPGIMQDVCRAAGILKTGRIGKGVSGLMRAREFDRFMATILADDPFCLVLRPPTRMCGNLALDALHKAAAMLDAWERGPRPAPSDMGFPLRRFEPAGPHETVREDCPAFAGWREVSGNRVPLCRANDRHPDLFRLGGVFNQCGVTDCEHCSWHQKHPPKGTPSS